MDMQGIPDRKQIQQAAIGGFAQGAATGVAGHDVQNGQNDAMSKMNQKLFETMMEQIRNMP